MCVKRSSIVKIGGSVSVSDWTCEEASRTAVKRIVVFVDIISGTDAGICKDIVMVKCYFLQSTLL